MGYACIEDSFWENEIGITRFTIFTQSYRRSDAHEFYVRVINNGEGETVDRERADDRIRVKNHIRVDKNIRASYQARCKC